MVAGIHGRWTDGALSIKATIAYDGARAVTRRAVPGDSASGEYDLHAWTADASLGYAMPLGDSWTMNPNLGVTAIRVTRAGVSETSNSAFALDVARDRHRAVFVDGALTFAGGVREDAAVRPHLSVGVRYRVDGEAPHALAALDGGEFGLGAVGVTRSALTATADLGADVALSQSLVIFGAVSGEVGELNQHASARAGLRLAF